MKKVKLKKVDKTDLELSCLYDTIRGMDPACDDYAKIVANIQKLEEVKAKKHTKLNADTVLTTLSSLVSVFAVLNFEKLGVLTSKAIQFIKRPK